MIECTQPYILVASLSTVELLPDVPCRVKVLDFPEYSSTSTKNPPVISRPEDILCVVFTSGSTGQPKAVPLLHRCVANFVSWYIPRMKLQLGSRASHACRLLLCCAVRALMIRHSDLQSTTRESRSSASPPTSTAHIGFGLALGISDVRATEEEFLSRPS